MRADDSQTSGFWTDRVENFLDGRSVDLTDRTDVRSGDADFDLLLRSSSRPLESDSSWCPALVCSTQPGPGSETLSRTSGLEVLRRDIRKGSLSMHLAGDRGLLCISLETRGELDVIYSVFVCFFCPMASFLERYDLFDSTKSQSVEDQLRLSFRNKKNKQYTLNEYRTQI